MTDDVSRETTLLERPDHTVVITVANQKGGVGKTTTAVNLSAALSKLGFSVLVIDLDPQGNASTAFDIDHREGTLDMYSVLLGGVELAAVVKPVEGFANLWCAPASISLAMAERELVSALAAEFRLGKALKPYLLRHQAEYGRPLDFVFIDCPPSLGLLTMNAFECAEELLVPIQCEYYALEGVAQLVKTLNLVQEELNSRLRLGHVLLTMADNRTILSNEVAADVRTNLGDLVLETQIPRSVRLSEAPSQHRTGIAHDPSSSGAVAYMAAARELAARYSRQVV